jgi:hypothetical protein
MYGFLHTRFHVPTAFPPVEVWKINERMVFAGVFKMFDSTVRVAQSDSVRILISDYYHPCVHGRREASEFVWWYYQVTAWTAEESTASLNSVFGTVRRRSRSLDRHMFWKKGIRFCYDVTPVRQCSPKSTYGLFFFHYPSAIFILGVPRSSVCYRICFTVVSFIMVLLRLLLLWPSYSLPLFTQSRDEHNTGNCQQCNVVDVP